MYFFFQPARARKKNRLYFDDETMITSESPSMKKLGKSPTRKIKAEPIEVEEEEDDEMITSDLPGYDFGGEVEIEPSSPEEQIVVPKGRGRPAGSKSTPSSTTRPYNRKSDVEGTPKGKGSESSSKGTPKSAQKAAQAEAAAKACESFYFIIIYFIKIVLKYSHLIYY